MTATKHTAGPWQRQHIGRNKWGAEVWTINNGAGQAEVAETYTIEDAHLIAAAPELLSALVLLAQADPQIAAATDEELVDAAGDEDDVVRAQAQAFLMARIAIAKATGAAA
jgi:hypothetical protein